MTTSGPTTAIISWIPADMISVAPDRQRRLHSKDSHTELVASIAEYGLIQPLVIDIDSKRQVELVAGERRLRAIRELLAQGKPIRLVDGQSQAGCVPVICLQDQPEDVRFAIELEENIRRLDITWQERVGAIKRLADMVRGKQPDATIEQIAAAAPVAGLNVSEMKSKLMIADWMNLPQVAGAPSEAEAKKRLVQHLEDSVKAQMALTMLKDLDDAETPGVRSRHTLLHGDSRMLLATLPPKFDIVLTDPPYGVGADSHFRGRAVAGGQDSVTHDYDDSLRTIEELLQWLPAAITAVTKPQAHLYLFCDIRHWPAWRSEFAAKGWDVCNRPLIWHKGRGPAGSADIWPMRCYEAVLYAVRGRRPTQGKLAGDVLTYEPVSQRKHAAQKPTALYADLLSRSALLGDHVLDPFCGSGTIFEVAEAAGIAATGIEKEAAAVALAQRRLAGEKEEDWQR